MNNNSFIPTIYNINKYEKKKLINSQIHPSHLYYQILLKQKIKTKKKKKEKEKHEEKK